MRADAALARLDRLRHARACSVPPRSASRCSGSCRLMPRCFAPGDAEGGHEQAGATFASPSPTCAYQRSLARLEHRSHRDARSSTTCCGQALATIIRRQIARRAAARMRARTFRERDDRNWMKHTLGWVERDADSALRLPAGAPEYVTDEVEADSAQGDGPTEENDGRVPLPPQFRSARAQAPTLRRRRASVPQRSASTASIRTSARTRASTPTKSTWTSCGPMVLDALIKIKNEIDSDADLPPLLPRRASAAPAP